MTLFYFLPWPSGPGYFHESHESIDQYPTTWIYKKREPADETHRICRKQQKAKKHWEAAKKQYQGRFFLFSPIDDAQQIVVNDDQGAWQKEKKGCTQLAEICNLFIRNLVLHCNHLPKCGNKKRPFNNFKGQKKGSATGTCPDSFRPVYIIKYFIANFATANNPWGLRVWVEGIIQRAVLAVGRRPSRLACSVPPDCGLGTIACCQRVCHAGLWRLKLSNWSAIWHGQGLPTRLRRIPGQNQHQG